MKEFNLITFEFKLNKSKVIQHSEISEEDIVDKKVFISDYQVEYCENIIKKLNQQIDNGLFFEIFDSLKKVKIIDSLINDPVCQYLYKELSLDKLTIWFNKIFYFWRI